MKNENIYHILRVMNYIPGCQRWIVEPYIGCSHRCIYCSMDTQGKSNPVIDPCDFEESLIQDLLSINAIPNTPDRGTEILLSLLTDPYVPEDVDLKLTRKAIEVFNRMNQPFKIITKGSGVIRDIDLLKNNVLAEVCFGLICDDDLQISKIEPGVDLPSKRISIINQLNDEGVNVSLNLAPWIPGISDITSLLAKLPSKIPVSVVPLDYHELVNASYLQSNSSFIYHFNGKLSKLVEEIRSKGIGKSALRVYSRRWSQEEINKLYADEFLKLHKRYKNIFWSTPPEWNGSKSSFYNFKEFYELDLILASNT
jgi:DNA repair photolyase